MMGTRAVDSHISNLLEVALLQQWEESLSRPVNTHDIYGEAVLEVIPIEIVLGKYLTRLEGASGLHRLYSSTDILAHAGIVY